MKVRGNFPSLAGYGFQNPGSDCNLLMWEEETKRELFGLMYKGGHLWLFGGRLWLLAGNLWLFAGTL